MSAPSIGAEPFGDGAVRFALREGTDLRAILDAMRGLPGVFDVVVTERHVCVHFDPEYPPMGLEAALDRAVHGSTAPGQRRLTIIRARYDGADLNGVATYANLSVDEVIAIHSAREYVVRFVGFMPGFAYLGDLDSRIAAPRLATPRPRVPARAIAIAGERTGVYPFVSPGGWNLIATALDFEPFTAAHGAALALGDRVRFEPA